LDSVDKLFDGIVIANGITGNEDNILSQSSMLAIILSMNA